MFDRRQKIFLKKSVIFLKKCSIIELTKDKNSNRKKLKKSGTFLVPRAYYIKKAFLS